MALRTATTPALGGPVRRLLVVWMAIGAGTWAVVVALAVHAINAFGPGAVGAVLAARLLPAVVAAPLTAHQLDRHPRAQTVAVFTAAQAAAFGAAAALVQLDASLAGLLALVAVGGAVGTAARPGLEALLPSLARTPQELTRATAYWSTLDNAGFLIGAGGGGIALVAVGPAAVMAVAAGLIGFGAILAGALPRLKATEPDHQAAEVTFRAELLGGLRVIRETPSLRVPILLFACLLFLEGTTDVLLVVLSIRELGMGNGGPGLLYGVWGLAGIGAGPLMLIVARSRGYGLTLLVGVLAHGLGLVLTGLDGVPLALAAMLPAGIGFALVETGTMALVPRVVDDAVLGRVYGFLEIIYMGMSGLGALAGPLLVSLFGASMGLVVTGGAYAATGAVCWHAMARLDAGQQKAGRVRELLRAVPFLASLPLPRLERLVRGSRGLAVRGGETIISRGEVGENFYVIEDGTVEVPEYRRRQGAGSSFGEIALLHDVPRTATVRALTDVRLRVLHRGAFLAAVTNQDEADARARAAATEHLARAAAN